MDNGGIWPGDEGYFQEIRETSLQDQVEQLTKELAEARAEIEQLKLTTGELTGAFNARPKCAKCKRRKCDCLEYRYFKKGIANE